MSIGNAKLLHQEYINNKGVYNKILNYFKGKTDAINNYQSTDRSNQKVSCNYLKKYVKEETSYSVGNDITYSSKQNIEDAITSISELMENFKENHDIQCFRNMVLFGLVFEVYYIARDGSLQARIVKPTEGWHRVDDEGNITEFIRAFTRVVEGELKEFYDYYTVEGIYHLNDKFEEVDPMTINIFSELPIGVAELSEELWEDTLYSDIKGLQDSLETILSDAVNEISDFRNAYLVTVGLMFGEEAGQTAEDMKKKGILSIDGEEGKVEWLIKNINDTFIQNTIKTIVEKLYELTSHINHNDSESTSNASGVALKSRLISLMQRCIFNQNSYKELLKTRLRIMFEYLQITKQKSFDWKDIKITFTPCIPSDDVQVADLITKLDGRVSLKTLISNLSFVENAQEELDRVKEEKDTLFNDDMFVNNDVNIDKNNSLHNNTNVNVNGGINE